MWVVGAGQTTHAADLINGGGYVPVQTLTAFREPDGIAVDQTGRFFVTADEGDTRDGAAASGPRGGRANEAVPSPRVLISSATAV